MHGKHGKPAPSADFLVPAASSSKQIFMFVIHGGQSESGTAGGGVTVHERRTTATYP